MAKAQEGPALADPSSPAGFGQALLTLRENAIAAREWRSLRKSLRDWRLWFGLRIPRDAREWGVPVIGWTALIPYIVWGIMLMVGRVSPAFVADLPRLRIDMTAICLWVYSGYSVLMSAIIMASAVTRERERETWDLVRSAALSRHEVLLGLLSGLLGPILLTQALVGVLWVLLEPHYRALLREVAPLFASPLQIAEIAIIALYASLAMGCVALAISSACRRTSVSVVLSIISVAMVPVVTLGALWLLTRQWPTVWVGVGLCSLVSATAYHLAYLSIKNER